MSEKSPGLEAELRARIAASGPIGFDEFMAAVLYDPRHGYYASEKLRTGKGGDFFTSVSVGPVFGKLLAAQFAQMWRELGEPEDFSLVEQGANDGQLMADILGAWNGVPPRVVIVEPLANLRALQQKTLAPWSRHVTHVAHECEIPEFKGVFFANELLDAFPVKLLARRNGRWHERRVGHDGEKFIFVEAAFPGAVPDISGEVDEFKTEVCPSLAPWMEAVAEKLQRGWIFLVDYGHPRHVRLHPARAAGSLAAYRDHQRVEDPLADPGHQDLTSHVDFTAVAEAAERAGLQIAGFTDQHHALTALAAEVFPSMPAQELAPEVAREMRALRQLLHPESMGRAFKFLALSRDTNAPLAAFHFASNARCELFENAHGPSGGSAG